MMNNQKVIPAILGCLKSHNNDQDLAKASAPLLQLVSELKDSDFIKGIDKEITSLLESLDQSREDFSMEHAMDNLELLNNFCLVEEILEKCVEKGLIEYESELMKTQFENRGSDDTKLHQRVLNSCTSSIKLLAMMRNGKNHSVMKQLLKSGCVAQLLQILEKDLDQRDAI